MKRSLAESLARPEVIALDPYRSARSLVSETGERDLVYLDANESPWPGGGEEGAAIHRYPEPQPRRLADLVAGGFDVERENFLMTRGVDEGIDLLVRAFCRAGTDAIAICPPTYGYYGIAAKIQGASVREIPFLREERGYRLDLDGIRREASRDRPARIVFLCSPNNPTGHTIPRDDVLAACDALEGVALVALDEAYVEFSENCSLAPAAGTPENLVVFRTLSKAWGLAGARFGLTFASREIVQMLKKICPPYPIPTPTTELVASALSERGWNAMRERVARIVASRTALGERCASLSFVREVVTGQANFLLIRVDDPAALVAHLLDRGVVVRDRSGEYGLEGFVRISVGDDRENERLARALDRFAARPGSVPRSGEEPA